MNEIDGITVKIAADTSDLVSGLNDISGIAQDVGDTLGSSLTSALEQAIVSGKSLSDVLRNVALELSRSALSAAMNPLQDAASSALGNVFGGLFGAANGAVVAGGRPTAFARGGVVSAPTAFPMRNGTGLMGEAGPEAIMPLTRGADGKLGVAAQGGAHPISVTVNISTPDAQSFRKSEAQIAGVMSRALSRANRNA